MIYVYREREREKIILWWSLSSLFSLDLLLTFTDSEGLQPPSNREHLSLFGMKLWQTSTDTTLDCTVNDTLVDHGFKPTQVDPINTGEGFCSQCERSCLNPAVCLHIIGFWRKILGEAREARESLPCLPARNLETVFPSRSGIMTRLQTMTC